MESGQIMVVVFDIFVVCIYIGYAIKANVKELNIMFNDMSIITKSKFKNYGTNSHSSNNNFWVNR